MPDLIAASQTSGLRKLHLFLKPWTGRERRYRDLLRTWRIILGWLRGEVEELFKLGMIQGWRVLIYLKRVGHKV